MSVDNRKHDRQQREEKIFIELLSASDDEANDNVLIECTTRDISPTGLKVHSNSPFIKNSVLELLINFESGGYKFLLTAEVMWSEDNGDDEFLAGFELLDAEHSDFIVWRKMFEEVT
jgi:hypothetical protein